MLRVAGVPLWAEAKTAPETPASGDWAQPNIAKTIVNQQACFFIPRVYGIVSRLTP